MNKLPSLIQFLQVLHRSGLKGSLCIVACVLAVAYAVFPGDFDFIPIIGWLDDALVLVTTFSCAVNTYRKNRALAGNNEGDKKGQDEQ
ncbi:MAG: YkvA family protein [Akkermansia sp.]|nr:YkvA family protein [Akkermansia sp.]